MIVLQSKAPFLQLLLALLLVGCGSDSGDSSKIRALCRDYEQLCDPSCDKKTFRSCYVDTEMFPGPNHDLFKHCYAVHVGNTCHPCQQIFSLNFGGSMRSVSCEDFQQALARKNRDCNGCLEKYGTSPR